MKMQQKTQFAIRVLLYLSQNPGYISVEKLCESTKASRKQLLGILRQLQDADILESGYGCKGGYRLKKSPMLISLYDVVTAVDNPLNNDWQTATPAQDETRENIAEVVLLTTLQRRMTDALKCITLGDYTMMPKDSRSNIPYPWRHGISPVLHINPIGYETGAVSRNR